MSHTITPAGSLGGQLTEWYPARPGLMDIRETPTEDRLKPGDPMFDLRCKFCDLKYTNIWLCDLLNAASNMESHQKWQHGK